MLGAFLLICLSLVAVGSAVTTSDIETYRAAIRSQLLTNDQQGDRNAILLVRLAFHDAVGVNGADGCVSFNLDNNPNAGLQRIFNAVRNLRNAMTNTMSLADFLHLAGVMAVERTMRYDGTPPQVQFLVGRQDTTDCSRTNNNAFPNPHGDFDATMTFFQTQFGLTPREAIVLLGAHSLGRANPNNSGFRGPWTSNENVLDNEYYRLLLNEDWHQREVTAFHFQWEPMPPPPKQRALTERAFLEKLLNLMSESRRKKRQMNGNPPPKKVMMLNVDMALIKDINVDARGQSLTCSNDVRACSDNEGRSVVQQLANSNNLFIEEFVLVYAKMINKAPGSSLTLPTVPTPAPAPVPAPAPKQQPPAPPKKGPPENKGPKRRTSERTLNEILESLLSRV